MCTQRIRRLKRDSKKPARHKRVHPVKDIKYTPTFTTDETIECKGCNQYFPLVVPDGTQGIKIHCAGCNEFYHCHIAGTCYGPRCTEKTSIGSAHQLSWCIHCVPKYAMNCEKESREEKCICHTCVKYL